MSVFLIKTNNITEIIFHFNRSIIEIIKQLNDTSFSTNKKRWIVPTSSIGILTEKLEANDIKYYIDDQTSTTQVPAKRALSDQTSITHMPAKRVLSDITNSQNLKVKIDDKNDVVYINLPIAPQLFHAVKNLDHVRDYSKNQLIIKGYAAFKKLCEVNNINIAQN